MTKLTFNGVPAALEDHSDTVIHAKVPPTATTGKIAVTTPNGTGSSAASFTVVLAPTISSISPTSTDRPARR